MMQHLNGLKRWFGALLLLGGMGSGGCRHQYDEAQLAVWHQEAIAANQQLLKANQKTQQPWQLTIQGRTPSGQVKSFDWQTLKGLAKTQISTIEPHPQSTAAVADFQGVPVSALIDRAGVVPEATDVTFVAFDAFRATLRLEDLQRYPILLALARNGKPIPRSEGGPLYLVHPITQFPELRRRYDSTAWVFYVTHVILGTEPARLRVGKRVLTAEDLDQLPPVTLNRPVGYRLFWPHGNVQLQGVKIQDALAAAQVALPADGMVTVQGKAPINRDPKQPFRLSANILKVCDVLIVRRWGNDLALLPAKMGGPLTLAFGPNCPAAIANQQPWMTFVQSLEVTS
jgi:hypothetical protein